MGTLTFTHTYASELAGVPLIDVPIQQWTGAFTVGVGLGHVATVINNFRVRLRRGSTGTVCWDVGISVFSPNAADGTSATVGVPGAAWGCTDWTQVQLVYDPGGTQYEAPGTVLTLTFTGAGIASTDALINYILTLGTSTGGSDSRYQLVAEKNQANGYAGLDSSTRVPTVRLGSGTADNTTFLRGDQSWATSSGGMTNPMTTVDDIIVGGSSGSPTRLAKGTDGQVLTINASTHHVAWATPSGGGTTRDATLPFAGLDTAPTTPHAKDDEFNGTSLDAKWTNPGVTTRTNLIAFNGDGWLMLEPSDTGSGSVSTRGAYAIRQTAPSGAFTITAKIVDSRSGDDVRVGIFVASTSASKAHMVSSARNNNRLAEAVGIPYSETADWGAFDGFVQAVTPYVYQAYWYQIIWNGSGTLTFNHSTDGFAWSTALGTRTGQVQPDRIGLAIWANVAGIFADHKLFCAWFRVTEP